MPSIAFFDAFSHVRNYLHVYLVKLLLKLEKAICTGRYGRVGLGNKDFEGRYNGKTIIHTVICVSMSM